MIIDYYYSHSHTYNYVIVLLPHFLSENVLFVSPEHVTVAMWNLHSCVCYIVLYLLLAWWIVDVGGQLYRWGLLYFEDLQWNHTEQFARNRKFNQIHHWFTTDSILITQTLLFGIWTRVSSITYSNSYTTRIHTNVFNLKYIVPYQKL